MKDVNEIGTCICLRRVTLSAIHLVKLEDMTNVVDEMQELGLNVAFNHLSKVGCVICHLLRREVNPHIENRSAP